MTQSLLRPNRVAIKMFADPQPQGSPDLEPYIGLFHHFIQAQSLEGLLLDVADYAHIPDGPGILLVGHDVDYGVDLGDRRVGLLTVRKRLEDNPLADAARDTLRRCVSAARAIADSGVGELVFSPAEFEVQLLDRLSAPNSDEGYDQARAELDGLLSEVFGSGGCAVARANAEDPRKPLSLRVSVPGAPDTAELLQGLGG
ncbi:hypothetical protein MK489_01545 [Myxococcota bacterium]|nr:hypothetical protein [Myxococcota bacterium]